MAGKEDYHYNQDVNYTLVDKLKVAAQEAARKTVKNMEKWGMHEITSSRGESCYLFEYTGKAPHVFGFVVEGLGTKNRAIQTFMQQLTFLDSALKSYQNSRNVKLTDQIIDIRTSITFPNRILPHFEAAVDTSMMILLDMISGGIAPAVLGAHYAAGASEWFKTEEHINAYCDGMIYVCDSVDCTWGPGETSVLTSIVHADSAVLDGSAFGVLIAKEPILGQSIKAGNKIVFVESSGLHANYLSGARRLADALPAGYLTPLSDGIPFGFAICKPTIVRYIPFLESLILEGIKLHYIIPITGHGLRKIMRASMPFTYRLHTLAPLSPLFRFMIEGLNLKGKAGAEEAMGGMNLGQGLALIVEDGEENKICNTAWNNFRLHAWVGGQVEEGPRQVIIENPDPIFTVNGQIVFTEKSMAIRSFKQ